MRPMIRAANVSKCYRIGGLAAGYATFREMFAGAVLKPVKRLRRRPSVEGQTIWALKDVSFEVAPGEVIGLIGHNGAGKSTLLKILSRITVPTRGRTEVYGKIGSLLEVGTGFHPDLTGRENIYLNGTILGITRAEIARKFDEIVAFSEIETFIDTPVKWYSSGMYLRLAFSVAVHLDTEVLIMDEVLAVGDVGFQLKCLDKMHAIRQQGRTILFVSHNMAAVTRLCQRVMHIERGRIVRDGPAHEVVNEYLGTSWNITAERAWPADAAPGNEYARLLAVRVRDRAGTTTSSTDIREPVGVELTYDVLRTGHAVTPKIELYSEQGVPIFAAHDVAADWAEARAPGRYVSTVWLPGNFLTEGNPLVHAALVSHRPATATHAHAPQAVTFQVVDRQEHGGARGAYVGAIPGVVRPLLEWTTERTDEQRAISGHD
jgi:lipopolysaccharide transport system ATP-binding protein